MRFSLLVPGLLGLTMATGSAQEAGTGRYAVEPSVDGFIRLDTETGAMSHCTRRDGVWRCESLAGDEAAVEALTDEVRALNQRVDELSERLTVLEGSGPAASAPPAARQVEEPGFAELLVERLIQLVRDIRGERQPSS
ncbi:MAG: hypothetical protein KDJ86_12900 [Bauldia sp.]|uniref:hypothetical protein n=1 Tax=Bauldia sp. TaxID=2575872 RepID=UPI001DDF4991|nr:hypothetical protein [Bauldia sp.]MCB1496680.1 hypothetical protein [Bauldia sp.]